MKVEDIIEGLNKHIEEKRKELNINTKGHLVLQKLITPSPTFKAYKFYEMILWFVKSGKRQRLLTISQTVKITDGQEESVNRSMGILLSTKLFGFIGTKEYEQVIQGGYETIKI